MHERAGLSGAAFLAEQTEGLAEPHGSPSLAVAVERSMRNNRKITKAIPQWESWREQAYAIKQDAIARLPELLEQLERHITARGATVLYARDAAEANQYMLDIAKEHQVKTVVKAKSMVSEEMELNHVFARNGIESLETDLGEYLVQLTGKRPTHIVTPALHLSAAEVGKLFAEKLGEPYTDKHEALTAIARKHLREKFIHADMGVSGANFGIADTGSLCLIENEGNIGLSISAPKIHVALMGIEKVIPKLAQLPLFLNLLPRNGTGQKLTSYAHLVHGATPGRKFYLIIIDNGRSKVLHDREVGGRPLFCIRCGGCMNACPVYRRAGGWAYGWVYPGPIGAILSPHFLGMDVAGELPFASSLCGACAEICPVKIDIPHELVHLRHRAVTEPSPKKSLVEKAMWVGYAKIMAPEWRYRLAMKGLKLGLPLVKCLPYHPWYLGAWTRGRTIPKAPRTPSEGSFRAWWKKHHTEFE